MTSDLVHSGLQRHFVVVQGREGLEKTVAHIATEIEDKTQSTTTKNF